MISTRTERDWLIGASALWECRERQIRFIFAAAVVALAIVPVAALLGVSEHTAFRTLAVVNSLAAVVIARDARRFCAAALELTVGEGPDRRQAVTLLGQVTQAVGFGGAALGILSVVLWSPPWSALLASGIACNTTVINFLLSKAVALHLRACREQVRPPA